MTIMDSNGNVLIEGHNQGAIFRQDPLEEFSRYMRNKAELTQDIAEFTAQIEEASRANDSEKLGNLTARLDMGNKILDNMVKMYEKEF